ncbi:helix-turn-helix domain-containing protein [Kineosporia sp. J2-2]|uniref:Helix-turn-helix domain-containing protein n=1 Tax=Kineosporia corallincola TaxID=2835133 RepID=A0ABS5TFJ2_9ACTN|nr:helix-turn-helix domain-containing protein [Kineosporia corallincola]MBT0769861.1 helix-turn-helix domain-containing protein [Kineosporia corallincola]
MISSFTAFQRRWDAMIGKDFRLPTFAPATVSGWHGADPLARLDDVIISRVSGTPGITTTDMPEDTAGRVRLWIVRSGGWTLHDPRRGSAYTVSAGQFLLHHGPAERFVSQPNTSSLHVAMPADAFDPRPAAGPVTTPEIRLVTAHAEMLHLAHRGLGPAGRRAARDTLVELARAVPRGGFDDAEPQLAPALAEAAKRLARERLADRDLTPAMLAREFSVSLRTLQRAFADSGTSVASYLREERLERARRDLEAGLSVTQTAARWHFADSSHLTRVYKRRYGHTPSTAMSAADQPATAQSLV